MSYRCQLTGQAMPPGTPAVRVVVAVRPATYNARDRADKRRIRGKRRVLQDGGGQGLEIARELVVSPEAAARLAGQAPTLEAARPVRRKTRLEEIEDALYGPAVPPPAGYRSR